MCVPLFGPGRLVFKVHMVISIRTWMMQQVVGRFRIFCCGYCQLMCVCDAMRQESCENSAFLLQLFLACVCVCMCVCIYVLRHVMQQSCENSVLSLQLFPAYVCVCLLCFVFGLGRAGFEVLINCRYFRI